MDNNNILKTKSFLLVIIVDIILVSFILFLMNYVQYLLNEDVRINLTEIVTQNKDVITSNLTLEMNNLELEAKQVVERLEKNDFLEQNQLEDVFIDYINEKKEESLVWADKDGNALSGSGMKIDLSGRAYFQLALKGTANISERLISRVNGEDVFVMCVPLVLNGNVVGTVQKQYTPQEMYSLCSVSLFSEQGSTYIINSQGYILICSDKSKYNKESDNYYRIIYLTDANASKRLEADITNNKSGFMEAVIEGEKVFFAYTPIERVPDWYLISSLPTNVVSPNANTVVRLFYFVLVVVITLFSFSLIYYLSMKRKQQAKLEKIAFVDPVTNGSSFAKFSVDMEQILKQESSEQYYICTLDIDNFKYINNVYGYETGDLILQNIYEHYQNKLSETERIARITGDHFVILMHGETSEQIKKRIELEYYVNDIKLYLSTGLYHVMDTKETVNMMIDKASTAAKRGKGKHFKAVELYSDVFFQEAAHTEQIKREVERALENNEIIPFYQPKVDVNTGELIGAEALARWITAEGRMISPAEFIPICEETGLITLIDNTIFEKTLQFIKSNMDNGIQCVPISVNFSRLHLFNDDFVDNILGKLKQYEVPSELIELELTETVIFDNYHTINAFINDLHNQGLKISIDDFGSGHSSLNMLKDVQIDVLKIDRGFLMESESSKRQRTIFGTIVQMANNLDMKVVVEGVETIENVNLMKEFGCAYAQGYFFSKPVNEELFSEIYKEGHV